MRLGFLMSMAVLAAVIVSADVAAADRHEGYYYPTVTSRETYTARAITLPDSDRARRIGFIKLHRSRAEKAFFSRRCIACAH